MENAKSAGDSDRELTLRRTFDVPAKYVFEAWTKPEHVKEWFGPKGYPVTFAEMDFRVGGKWRFRMTGPDGKDGPTFGGEYLAIDPNRKLQFTNGFELPDAEKMVMTITFEESNGKTALTFHTQFASPSMKNTYLAQGMEAGTNLTIDQLGEHAAKLARA